MTEVYHSLAHKDQVARIDIDEVGQTRVLSREGDEIIFDDQQVKTNCLQLH